MSRGLNSRTNITQHASASYVLWAAWQHTGDQKYLQPILDVGINALTTITPNMLDIANKRDDWGKYIYENTTPNSESEVMRHFAWQYSGDKKFLENYYKDMIETDEIYKYIDTEGSLWTDRVYVCEREIQRSRLGGVALSRNTIYPGHAISWKFNEPANNLSAAILVNYATQKELKLEVYNLEDFPINAEIVGWDVLPGKWEIVQGIDSNDDQKADKNITTKTVDFGLTDSCPFEFSLRENIIISMKLIEPGKAYSQRPDLGISIDDLEINGQELSVKLHNLGPVDAMPTTIALVNDNEEIVSLQISSIIKTAIDLIPNTEVVNLTLPDNVDLKNLSIIIDPDNEVEEITKWNNKINLNDLK